MHHRGYDGAVKRSAGIVAMVGIVFVLALLASSAAAADAVITERPLAGAQSADDVRRFWTPERMRRAAARPAPDASAAGVEPATDGSAPARAQASAVERPDTTSYPNRVVGRMFFVVPGEGLSSCTGAVVNTDTDEFVFTASHCVFERGIGFFENVTFVPGYRQGQRPFGEFPATELAVPSFVAAGAQLPFDHGSLQVAPTGGGQSVEDVVGSFGISLFGDPDQSWRVYGYPAGGAFDGQRLFTCDSPTTAFDIQFDLPPIGIDCDMTRGASGGPWLIQGTTLVGSNSSFIVEQIPDTLFGPQLRQGAAQLFDPAHPVECSGKPPTIVGTEESDRLVGSKAKDVILGDLGDDVIVGKGGKDKLCGEEGSDKVKGGKAKDFCDGGPGNDRGGGGCEKRKRL
jgi:V8-like Glu-specific endopeptidase